MQILLARGNFLRCVVAVSMILLISFTCSGCNKNKNIILTSDANTYLKENSSFNEKVKNILPSQEELKNAKILFYMLYDNRKEDAFSENLLRMTVEYSVDDFVKARKKMEELSEKYNSPSMSSSFYYDGVLYDGFMIFNDGYCAIAYSACSDTQTLSYIAFNSYNLQFMNVQSALELFPDFHCERQIVSH